MSIASISYHRFAVPESKQVPVCASVVCCKNGFVYCCSNGSLYVYNVADHILSSEDSKLRKDKILTNSKPLRIFSFKGVVNFLCINCDSSIIGVQQDTLFYLISIETIHATNKFEVQIDDLKPKVVNLMRQVVSINWSPVDSYLFFVVFEDGLSQLYKASCEQNGSINILGNISEVFSARAGSWSPKGKQYSLAVFTNNQAYIIQVDPNNLSIKRNIPLNPSLLKFEISKFEIINLCWFSTTCFLLAIQSETKTMVFQIQAPTKKEEIIINPLNSLSSHSKPNKVQHYEFLRLSAALPFVVCSWSYDCEDMIVLKMPPEGTLQAPEMVLTLPLPVSHTIFGICCTAFIYDSCPRMLSIVHTSGNVCLVNSFKPGPEATQEMKISFENALLEALKPPNVKFCQSKMTHIEPTINSTIVLSELNKVQSTNKTTIDFPNVVPQPALNVVKIEQTQITTIPPKLETLTTVMVIPESIIVLTEAFSKRILNERSLINKSWITLNSLLVKANKNSLCKINETQSVIQTALHFLSSLENINQQFKLASTEIRIDMIQTTGFLTHLSLLISDTISMKNLKRTRKKDLRLCPEAHHCFKSLKQKSQNIDETLQHIEDQLKDLNEQFSRLLSTSNIFESHKKSNLNEILSKNLVFNAKLIANERNRLTKLLHQFELDEKKHALKPQADNLAEKFGSLNLKSLNSSLDQAKVERDSQLFELFFPNSSNAKWDVQTIKSDSEIYGDNVVIEIETPVKLSYKDKLTKVKTMNLPKVRSPGCIFMKDLDSLGYISPVRQDALAQAFQPIDPGKPERLQMEPAKIPVTFETIAPNLSTPQQILSPVTSTMSLTPAQNRVESSPIFTPSNLMSTPVNKTIVSPIIDTSLNTGFESSKPLAIVQETNVVSLAPNVIFEKIADADSSKKTSSNLSATSLFIKNEETKTVPSLLFASPTANSQNQITSGLFSKDIQSPAKTVASSNVSSQGLFVVSTTASTTPESIFSTTSNAQKQPVGLFTTNLAGQTGSLFESKPTQPSNTLFTPKTSTQSSSVASTGLFASSTQQGSLFAPKTSSFGISQAQPVRSESLFESLPTASNTQSGSFFEASKPSSSVGLFSSTQQPSVSTGLFAGISNSNSGTGLFGPPQTSDNKPVQSTGLFASSDSTRTSNTGGLFGTQNTSSGLFTKPDATGDLSSIFGGSATNFGTQISPKSQENVFGKVSAKDISVPTGLFGSTNKTSVNVAQTQNVGLFSSLSSSQTQKPTTGLFSTNTPGPTGSLFGSPSAFGALAANNPLGGVLTSGTSTFGAQSGLFGSSSQQASQGDSLFSTLAKQAGSPPSQPSFGNFNQPAGSPSFASNPSFTQRRA